MTPFGSVFDFYLRGAHENADRRLNAAARPDARVLAAQIVIKSCRKTGRGQRLTHSPQLRAGTHNWAATGHDISRVPER